MRDRVEFNVDKRKLQEYFPFDVVLEGIFNIYQVINMIIDPAFNFNTIFHSI